MRGILLLQLVVCCLANAAVPKDGNVYFITNKKYYHARLAQWGTRGRDMGTYERHVAADQLWILREDKRYKGWFTIENAEYTGYRIAKSGEKTIIYNGNYFEDQLWKFVYAGNGYYFIYNKAYPAYRLTKFGKDDGDWGTYSGAKSDDQQWSFTPRFEADTSWYTVWGVDNRPGSHDIVRVRKVTRGLKLTKSSSFSTTKSLTTSLQAALFGIGASMETSIEISNTMETGSEKSWLEVRETTFTAPAGKNYRVRQPKAVFNSLLHDDDCVFTGDYKIEESTEDFED